MNVEIEIQVPQFPEKKFINGIFVTVQQLYNMYTVWHRFSYRPARLQKLIGRPVRQPYAGVNYIPRSGTMNLATDLEPESAEGLTQQKEFGL